MIENKNPTVAEIALAAGASAAGEMCLTQSEEILEMMEQNPEFWSHKFIDKFKQKIQFSSTLHTLINQNASQEQLRTEYERQTKAQPYSMTPIK